MPIATADCGDYAALMMSGTILSILMLAGFALSAGGVYLIAKKRDHKRGLLMIVAALVMFANVVIWQVPLPR